MIEERDLKRTRTYENSHSYSNNNNNNNEFLNSNNGHNHPNKYNNFNYNNNFFNNNEKRYNNNNYNNYNNRNQHNNLYNNNNNNNQNYHSNNYNSNNNYYNNGHRHYNNNNNNYKNNNDRRSPKRPYEPIRGHYSHSNGYYNYNHNNNNNNSSYKPWDDENSFYKPKIGEYISPRYKIKSIVGSGTFSTVVECWDESTQKDVAIKIVRSVKKYSEDAMVEIEILNILEKNVVDQDKFRCIKLLNWFTFKDHVCLVFKRHGISLYEFLKRNKYRPLALSDIQKISKQLLSAIYSMHSISLVHTDLKPENILLDDIEVNREYINQNNNNNNISDSSKLYDFYDDRLVPMQMLQIIRDKDYHNHQLNINNNVNLKELAADHYFHLQDDINIVVIDFGGATFETSHHTEIICSRPYRPPEIVLNLGWSFPADLWGLGCILFELYIGDTLFDTHNNRQHLAMMEKVIGPIPEIMHSNARVNLSNKSEWPDRIDDSERFNHLKKLKEYIHPNHDSFFDLISKLLEYHPSKRISAYDALCHSFFNEKIENDLIKI